MLNETKINEIKNQINLAIRSEKMSREHVVKAFELLADIQQTTAVAPIAARFGKPVKLPVVAPVRKPAANSRKDKLLTALRIRVYPVTINTLASDAGITKASAYTYIKELRQDGYAIKSIRAGTRKGKYQLARKGA